MTTEILTLDDIEDLAFRALVAVGASDRNARSMAVATVETEAQGIASHGLAYIPIYAEHIQCGKVIGDAIPTVTQTAAGVLVADAASGFAHPAIDLGFERLIALARQQGVAVLGVRNSYNCGVLGYHTGRLAKAGLLGLGFTNAPASIAPSGGTTPLLGTNPISIAVPGDTGEVAILIDQSASAIAKSEVMKHARENRPIPEGWALDSDGNPTTDPNIGLKGSMAPSGGYKGIGISLLVEVMAAALTGATLGKDASPFSGPRGGPPKTGQFFIAVDPLATSGGTFASRVQDLANAVHEDGARLPGDGRSGKSKGAVQNGVPVSKSTIAAIRDIIAQNV